MGTSNSDSGEQLKSCWSFLSLECGMEKRLSWITKTDSELTMVVSIVLSVRQLHDGWNHLFSDSNISDFKNGKRRINI